MMPTTKAVANGFSVAPPKMSTAPMAISVVTEVLMERRIVCSINKEMSGRPIPDIEQLIESETAAEAPAEV